MKLLESSEDYLESILIIGNEKVKVHAVDVARRLSFTKASVSIAIHKLEDNGYLKIKNNGEIILTPKGLEIAEAVYERHLILSEALMSLGVNKEQALKDACKIEHDLSEEAFELIKKHVMLNRK